MATIKPFRAVRPVKDKVALVASRSYEEYSEDELQCTLAHNPFSFLHIINPGFKYHKILAGEERFSLVKNRYWEFLEEKTFIKDQKPAFYLYQIKKDQFKTLGIFAATSVTDYDCGKIKKHEETLESRESLFAHYLETVGFNAEPVLITYESTKELEVLLNEQTTALPEYDFTTTDKVNHKLWPVYQADAISKITSIFSQMDALYIADGHHRCASSSLLAKAAKLAGNDTMHHDFFMSYLIPEKEVKIYEFNRMVKDLNGLSKEEFLIRLDTNFRIEQKPNNGNKPKEKHHFSMYLDGEFYLLYLRKQAYTFTDALSRLDTQILYKTILEPVLGIKDLRNDKRISYGYGKHNIIKMKDCIDKGDFKVGFSLVPITMEEIKQIADAGLVMPPKSTYIEPKLRSGLTIYEL
ncbi:hypothetical protein BUL40_05920 [Croceivirga radicis]|uniref:DUF1015 domain-containing protein n=1 Tax=Croceivirga radicis TaxID=1929488 RepID=A0A1V6LT56_9FLAO|nr:DUF1015 domain-containing protein [Croceivirga radicis]OQD43364.1 hypothetical protein BUL40_05920 [Croceivirga radicis]